MTLRAGSLLSVLSSALIVAGCASTTGLSQLQETIQLTRNQRAALLSKGPDRGLAIARPAATQSTAQEAYDLALLRYLEWIGNYLQVLSAEAPLLMQQDLDADLHSRQLTLPINLIRALGGGW